MLRRSFLPLLLSLLLPLACYAQAPPPDALPPAVDAVVSSAPHATAPAVPLVVNAPMPAVPVGAIDSAARAAADHDWQVLAASLLCIIAWGLRRFTGAAFFHTKAGALTVSGVMGVISGVLPALEAHTFTPRVAVVAVVVAVVSLVSMSNPSAAQAQAAPTMTAEDPVAQLARAAKGGTPVAALLFAFLSPSAALAAPFSLPPTAAALAWAVVGALAVAALLATALLYYSLRIVIAQRRIARLRAETARHLAELEAHATTLRGLQWRQLVRSSRRALAAFAFLAPAAAHADVVPTRPAEPASAAFIAFIVCLVIICGISVFRIASWIERRHVPRSRARNVARWLGGGSAAIVLFACGVAAAAPGFGLVLRPGPAELERNAAGVGDVRPFNPCELGPTRWLDRSCERELLLAQADEMPVAPPAAAPTPAVETQPPAAAAPAPVIAPEKPPAPPAAEKPPAQATDPRRAISNGATSQTAADCARCVTGSVALYKQRGGPLAIAGMVLGTLLDLTAHFVIPMLTAQGKPETDPMMAGATP